MSELKLWVYHGTEPAGVVQSAISLQWQPRFDSVGEAKLVCAATLQNRELLTLGAKLYATDTPGLAALVQAVSLSSEDAKMTVRAKFTLQLLAQRVCMGKYTPADAAEGLLQICRANLRGLPVTIPASAGFSAPCTAVQEWGSCLDAAETLAQAGGFGVSMQFDPATGGETLALRQGTDRTAPGTDAYRGYFSTRMGNLTKAEYEQDRSDWANVVICGGEEPSEGDTFTRSFCTVGAAASTGDARHELWVDGSSVRRRYTEQNADGEPEEKTYTEQEYQQQLQNYAAQALLNHLGTQKIQCTAANTQMIFGRDYDLGDRVPVLVEEFGLRASARVESVKLVYEATGCTVQPILDDFEVLT